MTTYIILSRLDTNINIKPEEFKEKIAINVADKIHKDCPDFTWKATYATIGHYDFINIVECDDPKQLEKASMYIRLYGKCTTETMVATPWNEFIEAF